MKRNYWPLFFIGIFSFVFSMIIWTIYSAVNTPVHEDKTFLKSYHELDRDFNDIVESNHKFLAKYNFKIDVNDKSFDLIFNDMFLSQRVIEEKSLHKNIFKTGENSLNIKILDKNTGKVIKDVKINMGITIPTNDNHIINFSNNEMKFENDIYKYNFNIPFKSNWNITGTFKIGNDIGYLFIKSNAI